MSPESDNQIQSAPAEVAADPVSPPSGQETAATTNAPTPGQSENGQTKPAADLSAMWNKVAASESPDSEIIAEDDTAETPETPETSEAPTPTTEPVAENQQPDDFDSKLPSDAEIDSKTGKYARVPAAVRDDLKMFAAEARKGAEAIEKLGGETALPVFETISNALFNSDEPREAAASLLSSIAEVNTPLLAQIAGDVFNDLWTLPDWKPLVDKKLEETFGEGYNSEKLQEIVSWLDAGLFDAEEMREQYGLDREISSPRLVALEKELAGAKAQLASGTAKQQNETATRDQFIREAVEISDQYIIDNVSDNLAAIGAKFGWEPSASDPEDVKASKDMLSQMRDAYLEKQYRTSTEFKQIKSLIEQDRAFDNRGNPTLAYQIQLDKITGKAKANFNNVARSLASNFARSFRESRNAQLANGNNLPPQTNTQNNQAPQQQSPPQKPNTGRPLVASDDELNALWNTQVAAQPADSATLRRMQNGR